MPKTSPFGLPYPSLSDSPDIPRDFRALALAVDQSLALLVMPEPKSKYLGQNDKSVTATTYAKITGYDLPFTNPHPFLWMSVRIEATGWCFLPNVSDIGKHARAIYIAPDYSGSGIREFASAGARCERTKVPNSSATGRFYGNFTSFRSVAIPPGGSVTAWPEAYTSGSASTGLLRHLRLTLTPISWSTNAPIESKPDPTDPDPPEA